MLSTEGAMADQGPEPLQMLWELLLFIAVDAWRVNVRFARSTFLTIALAIAVSASPASAKCMFGISKGTMGAAHIYRLSHEYRKRPDASANAFDALSYNLLWRAAEMGHAEAKADLPNRIHPVDEPASRTEFRRRMFNRAKANQAWAQKYLASDYLYSGHFEKPPP